MQIFYIEDSSVFAPQWVELQADVLDEFGRCCRIGLFVYVYASGLFPHQESSLNTLVSISSETTFPSSAVLSFYLSVVPIAFGGQAVMSRVSYNDHFC